MGGGGRGGVGGRNLGILSNSGILRILVLWVILVFWYSGIQGMLLPREHLPSLYNNTRLPRIPGARRFCKECHGETFSKNTLLSFGSCMNLTSSEKVSVALRELRKNHFQNLLGGSSPHWIEP